jgi:hypothetical protein
MEHLSLLWTWLMDRDVDDAGGQGSRMNFPRECRAVRSVSARPACSSG